MKIIIFLKRWYPWVGLVCIGLLFTADVMIAFKEKNPEAFMKAQSGPLAAIAAIFIVQLVSRK